MPFWPRPRVVCETPSPSRRSFYSPERTAPSRRQDRTPAPWRSGNGPWPSGLLTTSRPPDAARLPSRQPRRFICPCRPPNGRLESSVFPWTIQPGFAIRPAAGCSRHSPARLLSGVERQALAVHSRQTEVEVEAERLRTAC